MKRKIVISDIHGEFQTLLRLLYDISYSPSTDQLILLGDYINRGPNSLEVVQFIKQKVEQENAIALLGNHEKVFLDMLNSRHHNYDMFFLHQMNGVTCFESFLKAEPNDSFSNLEIAKEILKRDFEDEVKFLSSLPYYHEDDFHIFVHAGVQAHDWLKTPPIDFLWLGSEFFQYPTFLDKVVVFGHTPTSKITGDQRNHIWFDSLGDKIGIDGGCGSSNGQLNALEITSEGYLEHFYF